MTAPFEIIGRRGVLNLYFEGDELAIDLTEYMKNPRTGLPKSVEMFMTHDQVGLLIKFLSSMRDAMEGRRNRGTREAARQLTHAGVSPLDPAEVPPEELRRNPDVQESVALFYLTEVNAARAPEYPF